jgi:hypothetical protein
VDGREDTAQHERESWERGFVVQGVNGVDGVGEGEEIGGREGCGLDAAD